MLRRWPIDRLPSPMPMPAAASTPRPARSRRAVCALAALLAVACSAPARAQTLLQAFARAQQHQPQLRGARAAYAAALQRVPAARARLLPQISASAGLADGLHDETGTPLLRMFGLVTHWNFLQRDVGVDATQALYAPGDDIAVRQARLAAEIAYARLARADQELILAVAQDYFDLLAARDSVQSLRGEQRATLRQLQAAHAQFDAGRGTIVNVRDAQARADLLAARLIAARNQRALARDTLQTLIGGRLGRPAPLLEAARLPAPAGDAAQWAARAERDNLQVAQARLALRIARWQVRRTASEGLPRVQAYARVDRLSTSGGGQVFPFGDRIDSASIGVRMQWPLFTGYALSSQQREDAALLDKARQDLEAARETASLQARSAFAAWAAARARAHALRVALRSSGSALQAERTGFDVGLRVSQDVLDALARVSDTRREAEQARYDQVMQSLRLKFAAGRLDERDLAEVDALLRGGSGEEPGQPGTPRNSPPASAPAR